MRQFAKCIGRGALTLGTIQTIPTETLQYPEISKVGLLGSNKQKAIYKEEVENQQWALFHNGVATGLQLATEF